MIACASLLPSRSGGTIAISGFLTGPSLAAVAHRRHFAPASSSSTEEAARTVVNEESAEEERRFLDRCRELCERRNLPLSRVKNARDLASVRNSPVRPGRVFRMGRVSDATEEDLDLLLNRLNITTFVDLRSPTEWKDDPTLMRDEVFHNFTTVLWKEQGKKAGCVRELPPGEPPVKPRGELERGERLRRLVRRGGGGGGGGGKAQSIDTSILLTVPDETDGEEADDDDLCYDCGDPLPPKRHRRERHFVSLMNEFKYVKGTVSKVRKRDITKALLKSPGAIFSRRVRSSVKKPFLEEINDGGLPMVNELLLRFGAPGIRYVLELCADTSRHPVAFYCTAGKDRTGVLAALILSLVGVEAEDIVEDYTLSANVYAELNDHRAMVGALSQRDLNPKTFLGAPASVMRDTLADIEAEYGSVEGYCNWIGFGPEQQQKLRDAVTKP
jgi:protein tyrosine/serine phosphatase